MSANKPPESLRQEYAKNGHAFGTFTAEELRLKATGHTTGHNLTDLGNAERLAELHGEDFRYAHQWGRALAWDGKRFAQDTTGVVERMAKNTVRSIYAEAENAEDSDERKALSQDDH